MNQYKLKDASKREIEFFLIALHQRFDGLILAKNATELDLINFKILATKRLFKKLDNKISAGKIIPKKMSLTLEWDAIRVLADACIFFENGTPHQKALAEKTKQQLIPVLLRAETYLKP